MKEWFSSLAQREQMSLLALCIALLFYCVYLFVWSPLDNKREQLRLQNDAIAQSRARVDAMASQLLQLRESGAQVSARGNLTTIINQSTSRYKLPVIRLQPNSRGEIQVRLENAAFDNVLQWLHAIEYGNGLLVREVSVTRTGTVGLVNVTVRIAEAG